MNPVSSIPFHRRSSAVRGGGLGLGSSKMWTKIQSIVGMSSVSKNLFVLNYDKPFYVFYTLYGRSGARAEANPDHNLEQ